MKPPSRKRAAPRRFVVKQEEPERRVQARGGWSGWSRTERRQLLTALKKQSNLKDVDVDALKAKVAKRSAAEINSFLEFLKSRVGKIVAQHVRRQWREESAARVPIEQWESLARDMAGSLEEAISSAFAQTLVIGATEPGSLLHSVPPRTLSFPEKPTASSGTIRLKPLIRSCSSDASASLQPSPGQAVTSVAAPGTPPPGACSLSSTSGPVSTPVGTAVPEASTPAGPDQMCVEQRSPAQPDSCPQQEHTVNFENIYRFLNSVSKKAKEPSLSAMESAVVLDLLLSLPEEVTLLDCQELQHHLRQVYTRLSSTAEEPRPCGRQGGALPEAPSKRPAQTRQAPVLPESGRADPAGPNASELEKGHSSFRLTKEGTLSSDGCSVSQVGVSVMESTGRLEAGRRGDGMGCLTDKEPHMAPDANGSYTGRSGTLVNNGTLKKEVHAQLNRRDAADWATAGLCPLNPFMVPLKLLTRVKATGAQAEP